MIFTTITYLLFFPLVFVLYWALKERRRQNLLLILAGYFFYGWWDVRFCALMLATSLIDFGVGLAMGRATAPAHRRGWLVLSLIVNLGVLGFFKYFNFFAENFCQLLGAAGLHTSTFTLKVILPVGLSFYTFQEMTYTIDVYRKRVEPCRDLISFLAFVSFFPQLVAGPIERASHLLGQMRQSRRFDYPLAVNACRQILWGFAKKMILADNLGLFVDSIYAAPAQHSGAECVVATVFFAFQIYCDFSAYSDIAIGSARLLGFDIIRNFAYPYFSQSVSEFWRRWHISLSTWFRDYLYIPLGGSRISQKRTALNLMIVFLLSGLWHGASWNYVIWGGLNGIGILPSIWRHKTQKARPEEIPGGELLFPQIGTIGRMAATFSFICVAWVFFRASTFSDALTVFSKSARSLSPGALSAWAAVGLGEYGWLFIALAIFCVLEWLQRRHHHGLKVDWMPQPVRWGVYLAVALAVFRFGLSSQEGRAFIYFQF